MPLNKDIKSYCIKLSQNYTLMYNHFGSIICYIWHNTTDMLSNFAFFLFASFLLGLIIHLSLNIEKGGCSFK